ncbi:hypothetical protein Ppa06_38800 [Planomonospora parontospora subsp. parontospora]|uniref:Restriction endonuclease type IV Mrr domain-containing protein n=2 Tax=Planomonospora parontospora TaxID=58119 RepID=A0AA37F5U1_9ACTN|nr:restriction endonuclease [Planomonospora parontospora]GGK76811.1 hypothetical protein GCM10010126_40110 [Planomonospora parontospora]GII10082.1 hypothetical protein Ppa06_38800 [Planomonospora parontospora subsp. parontospora]
MVDFGLSRYKFIDEVDAASGLDGRPSIVEMDPLKFEQRGLKFWTTQSSRADGVDGVVVNEDPVLGGVCTIQAKRYKNAVSPNDVRALAGSIEDMRAYKGILVTTSWVGSAGRQFAARAYPAHRGYRAQAPPEGTPRPRRTRRSSQTAPRRR